MTLPPAVVDPANNIDVFASARYLDKTPRLTRAGSMAPPSFTAKKNIGLLEYVGRVLPTGLGEDAADAIAGFITNVANPDIGLEVSAWIQTDRNKETIMNWGVSIPLPDIDESLEAAGARPIIWRKLDVPTKEAALAILENNPELVRDLLKQTNIPDNRE